MHAVASNHYLMNIKYFLCLLCLTFCVSACSFFNDDEPDRSSEELYQRAKDALSYGNYSDAIIKYEELETYFPFSLYAKKAILEASYAHYKNFNPLIAAEKLHSFIKQYPDDPYIPYAYYLRGLANYKSGEGVINRILHFDRSNKDPQPLTAAFESFRAIVIQFPDSIYAKDAQRRLVLIRNLLAVYELKVADYYFRRKVYLAALNRIKFMLEHYTGAQHTPQGLLLMTETYRRLGRTDLANDTRRVLALNYPDFTKTRIRPDGRPIILPDPGWLERFDGLSDELIETIRKTT